STYMRNLESSGWMTKPDLSIIEARDGVAGLPYAFTLGVTLANPNAPKDEDGDGIPDAVPPVDAAPAAAADAADAAAPAAEAQTDETAGDASTQGDAPAAGEEPQAASTPEALPEGAAL